MKFTPRIFALILGLVAPLFAATDDLSDNFNRPDGTALGQTSGGAYPWVVSAAPDGTRPVLAGGQLRFQSTRAAGGASTGIGPMAVSIGRHFIEDVRIAFDLTIDATNGADDQWVGVTWRQIGTGFDLSGYAVIIRPDGLLTFFSPGLGSVLFQGNIGAFVAGQARRIEVESVGSRHRIRVNTTLLAEVIDASPAYAHTSFVTLHPDTATTPGTFRREIDNLVVTNLREFGAGFPTFRSSDSTTTDRLNRLFRYHYGYVLNPGPVRGVQQTNWREWNALSTVFVDTAAHPSGPHDIKAELRANLLAIPLDDEGYVFTYDPNSPGGNFFPTIGWPFPTYGNSGTESDRELGRRGKAYLWDQRTDTVNWTATGSSSSTPGVGGWRVQGTGPVTVTSPAITGSGTFLSPWSPYRPMETFHSPYLALLGVPAEYEVEVNWRLQGDTGWPTGNSVISPPPAASPATNRYIPMHRHANWYGPSATNRNVVQLRLILRRPGGGPVDVTLRRLQSHYDTRHATNNSNLVLGSARYYNWTGDTDFLAANLGRMRAAMEHLHTGLAGTSLGLLRVNYIGHDGQPSAFNSGWGRGIGSNYYDLLPFGHHDAYSTAYYLGAIEAMADIEERVAALGGLSLPAPARSAASLRALASGVRDSVNAYFWNPTTGRFVGAVDTAGTAHDFGFTAVNLEGMFYGFGTAAQRASIFSWLDGGRTVSGDTSTGSDIYGWRFAPRFSTRKNSTWYNWIWPNSKRTQPFGDQIQDGGGVLYLNFYDVMTRLEQQGADAAYQKLRAVTDWFAEVEAEGGYLAYYATRPGIVQGAIVNGEGEGGLGLHLEFTESTMVPAAFLYGFLGVNARPDVLEIGPRLPSDLEWAAVDNIHYRGSSWDVRAERVSERIEITRRGPGAATVNLRFRHLQPNTLYTFGAATQFETDAQGQAQLTANFPAGETLALRPYEEPPVLVFDRVLFRDNFASGLTPPASTANLGANQGLAGGRQTGELPETVSPAGWSWTVYGTTSFGADNGWDLRAQAGWPPVQPVDPDTLRFRNNTPNQWSTVTPNIGFPSFFAEGAYRVQVQIVHAHIETSGSPINDRWAGLSFGAQPDIRFPAFAANGGVIVYPGGAYTVFANAAAIASGSVPVPPSGVFALDLRVRDGLGTLAINGTTVAENLNFSAINPAWIGLTVLSGTNPVVFSSTQVRFDNFTVSTLGEFSGHRFAAWSGERWGGFLQGASGPTDDPDRAGWPNLLRYAMGFGPTEKVPTGTIQLERVALPGAGGTAFAFTYRERLDMLDYVVFPQRSTNLQDWQPAQPGEVELFFDVAPGEAGEDGVWRERIAIDRDETQGTPRRFYRLRVEPRP